MVPPLPPQPPYLAGPWPVTCTTSYVTCVGLILLSALGHLFPHPPQAAQAP